MPPHGSNGPPNFEHQPLAAHDRDDRLIATLQTCFSALLKQQEEQADRLHIAIAALKSIVPATDKRTSFWNLYKTLADEHDKEFHQRYSIDLDASLIFAGLFSAVDSAFIIQIQPEIQPQGTRRSIMIAQCLLYISLCATLLAALLAVLGKQWLMYYSAAGERGTIEARGLERQRKFDGLRKWKFDLIMQMFPLLLQLGLLLFASALCVYLWTIHLSLVIIVSSCTSFGFVSYVLLLVSAAVSPDSPFQTPLTPVVAQLIPKTLWTRATGSLNWLATPFRRSMHTISSACFLYIRTMWDVLPRLSKRNSPHEPTKINEATTLFDTPFPETSPEVPAVSWVLETSTDPHIITAAAEIVVDLQWPSTMNLRPQMTKLHDNILACFDILPSTRRDSTSGRIRNGMSLRAIHLGRAYCALRCVHPSLGNSEPSFPPFPEDETVEPELSNLFRILEGKPNVILNADASGATKWALHVIPSLGHARSTPKLQDLKYFLDQFRPGIQNLDPTNFSNYLFCVNGFLSTPRSSDIVRMDKSQFQFRVQLVGHLFTTIASKLQTEEIPMDTAAAIIETTGRLARISENYKWHYLHPIDYYDCQSIIYRFCSFLPPKDGWFDIVMITGLLTGNHCYFRPKSKLRLGARWVYQTLERVNTDTENHDRWDGKTVIGISGLFAALLHHNAPPAKEHVHLLLRALSIPGDISVNAAHLLLQDNIVNWFQDIKLRPILRDASLWACVARVALERHDDLFIRRDFIRMGYNLAAMPEWKSDIRKDLASWITVGFVREDNRDPLILQQYISVLSRVWEPNIPDYPFIDAGEKALGVTLSTLSKVWADFTRNERVRLSSQKMVALEPAVSHRAHKYAALLRSTSWAILREQFTTGRTSQAVRLDLRTFNETFSVPLYESLIRAAREVRNTARNGLGNNIGELAPEQKALPVFDRIATILEDLIGVMPKVTETEDEENPDYWRKLRCRFDRDIDALER